MTIVVAVLAAVLVVGGVFFYRQSSRSLVARYTRKVVIVTLKSSDTFQGVLYRTEPDALLIRNAVAVAVGLDSDNYPVDGELMVLRADIAYLQFP